MLIRLLTGLLLLAASAGRLMAEDMSLSDVLIPGEGWKRVADGYQFTDAACADAEGNFYFADVAKGGAVFKIAPDGKVSTYISNAPRISGLKFGPDGHLYAATQGALKQIISFLPTGAIRVLVSDVEPNDLVVSHKGFVYFTETDKGRVSVITPAGLVQVADEGPYKPNGITLSADQGTLATTDFTGQAVMTFRVETNGNLTAREPYMPLRTPAGKVQSQGDGMTTDSKGRYYAASAVGIQVFDPTGRACGVILKPDAGFISNVAFAGPELSYLYVTASDKIYRRKTQAKACLFFQPPLR